MMDTYKSFLKKSTMFRVANKSIGTFALLFGTFALQLRRRMSLSWSIIPHRDSLSTLCLRQAVRQHKKRCVKNVLRVFMTVLLCILALMVDMLP